MSQSPTSPPSQPRAQGSGSPAPLRDDFAADYEGDPTSINQVPRDGAQAVPRPSGTMHPPLGVPPSHFASASPSLSQLSGIQSHYASAPQHGGATVAAPPALIHGMPGLPNAMPPAPSQAAPPMPQTIPPPIPQSMSPSIAPALSQAMAPVSGGVVQSTPYVSRSRIYAFVVDETGLPIELGSGRFAKCYLGEERWVESKTTLRRPVAIKVLQRGVSPEDQMRFQMEKEILERVQGHPNIVELLGSGEGDSTGFIPPVVRDRVENDFMILELLDMSLEERLKGARQKRRRDDLLAIPLRERIFRVLEYIIPVATAVEFSHLVRDTCHRDIKPANILVKLPDPNLRGAQMKVKLADFNVGKVADPDLDVSMTRFQAVPGTLYFQSPEQETNTFELLVNVTQGSPEVEFFEDFYIDIYENDSFALFNRNETYSIAAADRTRKKLLLNRPFAEPSEINVRGRVVKSVGRPADIYSLGAVFYYLISGAYANPKNLFDAFRKFVEYEKRDENNSIAAYVEHEYRTIQNMRAPKLEGQGAPELAPEDRFFSYKHYLDGNGELIDPMILMIIAKAMIRNKPDSYCLSYDLRTTGISSMVHDLLSLYVAYGVDPSARIAYSNDGYQAPKKGGAMRRALDKLFKK
jgi:serine/threonine protein kinase